MAKLISAAAVAAPMPVVVGSCSLLMPDLGQITSIAPLDGAEGAVSAALEAAHGLGFPAPRHSTRSDTARCIWTGRGQAMLIGPAPDPGLSAKAALSDQTDAWAIFRLEGADARAVLARLTPVDLHPAIFTDGSTARTLLQHLACSITRTGPDRYDLMVFRSMAETALHDLSTAMRSVAAQAALH